MIAETEIALPVRTVYDQWTQFEDFPLFMRHVEDVRQIDPTHVQWKVRIDRVTREWTAEIVEQTPDQRIAWTATDGTKNAGAVDFHALDDNRTRVTLHLDFDPHGFLEKVADWGGIVKDRARADLDSFRDFIEHRGAATGAWRGQVERETTRDLRMAYERFKDMSDEELVRRASEVGISRPLDRNREWLTQALAAHDVRAGARR
jgi:uncharacterized membrane protein